MPRLLSLLQIHFATILGRAVDFAILAFVLVLLFTAMSFAGWMDAPRDGMHCVWMGMLLCHYAVLMVFVDADGGRGAFFLARRRLRAWCWTQAFAHWLVSLVYIAVALVAVAVGWGVGDGFFAQAGILVLFSFVFAQAAYTTLQPSFLAFSLSKRKALLLVISAPWTLTAWILGLAACDAATVADPVPAGALVALALAQTAVSLAGTRESSRTAK